MAAKKNSLVENLNRRKRAGTSRPKSKSTISTEAYAQMQRGWPSKKRKAKTKKSASARQTASASRARRAKAPRRKTPRRQTRGG